MSYDKVFKNVQNLHKINFTKILSISNYDDNFSLSDKYYDFSENGKYNNGRFKGRIENCCHKCDKFNSIKENNVSSADFEKYKNYKLENVSHGSHTIDYLNSSGYDTSNIDSMFEINNWNDTPVLFLMENPSIDYEIYEQVGNKYPTKTWYWIHRRLNQPDYMIQNLDNYLIQGEYGQMVYALICKYKLANAYLTNIIKCGMNNKNDPNFKSEGYLGTWWYKDECKRTCINEILNKEIQMLCNGYNRIKVFAFGSNAYWLAKDYFQNSSSKILENLDIQLVQLPHPSSRLSNNYRKYVVKGIVEDVLKNDQQFVLNNDCLPTELILKDKLKEYFSNKGIDTTAKKTNNKKLWIKLKLQNTLFNNTDSLVTEVEIIAGVNNQYLNNSVKIGYGYNFLTSKFWGWDYDNLEPIECTSIKTFNIFKKAIESLKL